MTIPFLRSEQFDASDMVRHGFFGRVGGVSQGDFGELNVSFAVGDDPDAVSHNRNLVAGTMGGGSLVILRQVHSSRVVTVEAGAVPDAAVEADALVTRRADVLLGILTADCAPLLFLDPHAGVIGAAHAGWKGALGGIVDNTLTAMESLGAQRRRITIAIGPTISGINYEVGPQFMGDALALNPGAVDAFFLPETGREHFDLPAFLAGDAIRAGAAAFTRHDTCTYAHPEQFFSHRRATHQDGRTGRQIAAIGLA